jgi:hypothetical protein
MEHREQVLEAVRDECLFHLLRYVYIGNVTEDAKWAARTLLDAMDMDTTVVVQLISTNPPADDLRIVCKTWRRLLEEEE